MLECLIIGDSIAHGVAMHRHECVDYGHVGWTSKKVNNFYREQYIGADTVIISLGTNDTRNIDTYGELSQLRSRIHSKRVIWIVPAAVNPNSGVSTNKVQHDVTSVATIYSDLVVYIPQPTADRYHPTTKGYKQLAKETK